MKLITLTVLLLISIQLVAQSKPRVRTITGFVRLDQATYEKQIADALIVLHRGKTEFETAGYQVETLRLTTQPLGEPIVGMSNERALAFLASLDELSAKENFLLNVGPAMMHDTDDPAPMHLLELTLSTLPHIEASAIIADEAGIHWKTIHRTSELVKYVAKHSPRSQGTFNFTATAMLKPLSPFFPGSYHTGPGREFAIGFEGANVVADVAQETGWSYVGVDPTPAPLGDVSIAAAIEDFTGAKFGSSGTLTAARIITAAVKAVPVKQIGYSGLMVPVMEDKLMAKRWAESTYNIDSLLAYSSVCGTGLDTIPLPGDVTIEQMDRIYADVASLATKWNKPLSARLQPIPNKKPDDQTNFDSPYLFNTTIHALP